MSIDEKDISSVEASAPVSEKENVWQQVVQDLLQLLGIGDVFSYASVIKQAMFICFLIGLAVFHIYNSHKSVRWVREKNQLEQEIKELRWEEMSIKSDLLKRSMQSDIERDIEALGLESAKTPPFKIVVPKNEN